MKTRLTSLGAAIAWTVLASASLVAAGDALDAKQARELSKIVRKVAQIEKAVTSLETSRTRGTPAFADTVTRKSGQQEKRFRAASSALAALPSCPEVEAQQKRLGDLKGRLAEVVSEARGQTKDSATKSKAWQAHARSPQHAADKALLSGLEVYQSYRFELKDRSFRSLSDETFLETIALLDALPQVEARLSGLQKRYEAFGREGQSMLGSLEAARGRLEACKKARAGARAGGSAALAKLGQELGSETGKVLALRDQALAAKRPFPLAYSLMDRTSKCSQLEQQILRTLAYLIRLDPGRLLELQAAADSALAGYRRVVKETRAEILASQKSPPDDYRGPDASELKAFATKAAGGRTHGAKVLSVHLSGPWEEVKKQVWDRTSKAWVQVHKSSLSGYLLTDHDSQYVFKRRIELERDHLRGEALQLFGDFQRYPAPRPDQLIPRQNLTK